MFQIDTMTAVGSEPAPSAPGTPGWFTDGDPLNGIRPTVLSADFANMLQDELRAIVTAAGKTPTKGVNNQVLQAIEILIEARAGNYVVDTGVANAYIVGISPAPDGTTSFPFSFRAVHANTTACTVDFGFGPVALDRDDGTAMHSGDIGPNSIVMGEYDHALNKALVQGIVVSQLGALAKLNIGGGLFDDGLGNLASQAALIVNYTNFF